MSISTVYAPVSYNGDGIQDAFAFTWAINASSEIVVTETIIATGAETIKTLTTHYTVSGTGPGTVIAVVAPPATVRWKIGRNVASTQLVDYVENDSFPAETHEGALDKLTMLSQEHDQNHLRTLRQPDGDADDIAVLPSKVVRASTYAAWDADGDPTVAAGTSNSLITTPYSETLLDDATEVAARATLGVPGDLDTTFILKDNSDMTKLLMLSLNAITPATTRTITIPDKSGTMAMTIDALITRLTEQTTSSGTAFDFTIPSSAQRITVVFLGVSLSGTDNLLVQLGTSGGVATTAYVSTSAALAAAGTTVASSTAGFIIKSGVAANSFFGTMTISRHHTVNHDWVASHSLSSSTTICAVGGGSKTIAQELTTVRITRSGADTFDLGEVSVHVEY